MSIEALGAAAAADEARVISASLHLAAALADEASSASAGPAQAERSHAAVASAEVALAQAEAAVNADQATADPTAGGTQISGSTPTHVLEVVV